MKQHRERLTATHRKEDIVNLEDKSRTFKKHISVIPSVFNEMWQCETCTTKGDDLFGKAWLPFSNRFKASLAFCGGLPNVFLGTATVECDFSKINLKRNDYRSHLTDLSLEGLLQGKQFDVLRKLSHS